MKSCKSFIDDILNKILKTNGIEYGIYCDTDSVYVDVQKIVDLHCQGKTDQEIVTFLEKFVFSVVQPELNKRLKALSQTMGIDDCKISFKLECIGPSLIMLAKKRYLFDILYSEGVRYQEPKMKVMGVEIVRSNTPSVVKEYLIGAAKICLRGTESELQVYAKDIEVKFGKLHYTEMSIPKGVNGMSTYKSDSSIYGFKTPMHVKGSLLYNHYLTVNKLDVKYPLIKDGDKIKYIMLNKKNPIREPVIAFHDKLPPELDLVKYINYGEQYDKVFVRPLESILAAMKWNMKEQVNTDCWFE